MRSTIREQHLSGVRHPSRLPAASEPCNGKYRGDGRACSARTGRTLWNHLALLHLDQLVTGEDCLLMFCGRVDLLSINRRINKVQAYLFGFLFSMWRIRGLQQSKDGAKTWASWFQRIFVWLVLLVVRYIYKSNARAVKTNLTYAKTITIHLVSESGK